MTSNRPYLARALFDWIVDNNCTPYIVLSAELPGVEVPLDYVEDGKIVLNVSATAVRDFHIANDTVSFDGRFAGRSHRIRSPIGGLLAIYAKETGQGMAFEEESDGGSPRPGEPSGGHLKVVK
ncbi:MAG: ClpXP protease specificity-enhancing factor [Gammaproteobacteria bacterium]|nr:MAG: ClpXP protease specificity-enhancing factor [Gammaproteobacteria bacterium]